MCNAQANNIANFAPLRKTINYKLQVIQSLLPESISISQWEYEDAKLLFTLNGIANNREDLLKFKTKLDQSGEFAIITLPLGSLELAENVRFSLTFVINK